MKKELFPAKERGRADYGWLQTRYSFSFAEWFNPSRMGFGALRVINDDVIAPKGKFGMHSHANFEIITIPLAGSVTHTDSMGNTGVVSAGEVQVMSAGRGVTHSEYNDSETEPLSLFQIWIQPNIQEAEPRYAQSAFSSEEHANVWQVLVSDGSVPKSLPIYQNARIARASIDTGSSLTYRLSDSRNGVYLFVIEGEVVVADETLDTRDAIGISQIEECVIDATTSSSVLCIEVPMNDEVSLA